MINIMKPTLVYLFYFIIDFDDLVIYLITC